jgi:hypothetical protein
MPLGQWHIFIDTPLPPGHSEFNAFYEFLRPPDWPDHKKEVLKYWIRKKMPRGKAKAILLRRKGLLTPDELLKIKTQK